MYFSALKILMFTYLNVAHLEYLLGVRNIESVIYFILIGFLLLKVSPGENNSRTNSSVVVMQLAVFLFINFIIGYCGSYFYLESFVYESIKLCIPFSFLILTKYKPEDQIRLINAFREVMAWIIVLNTIIIPIQMIMLYRYPTMQVMAAYSVEKFRPSGIFFSCNNMGISLVFYYIFEHILSKSNLEVKPLPKYLRVLMIFDIIASMSKMSMLCFSLVFAETKNFFKLKYIVLAAVLIVGVQYVFYVNNISNTRDKIDQYIVLITERENASQRYLEGRAIAIQEAYSLARRNFPRGYGLGTWGDGSSLGNPNAAEIRESNTVRVRFADSTLAHYIVEQGMLVLLYLYILFRVIGRTRLGKLTFAITILMLSSMQCFAQGNFPLFAIMTFWALISNQLQPREIQEESKAKTGNGFFVRKKANAI